MKIEVEQQWLINIMQTVYEMRDAQKQYFSSPNEYRLKLSKVKEGKVDQIVNEAIQHGYVKVKTKVQSTTPTLFK